MARQISSDHAIVFWQSHRILRKHAEAAFASVGREELLPSPDHFNALKQAVADIVGAYGVIDDGPVRPYGLSGHSGKVGVEARRFVRGATRNDLPFLFSLGAMRQNDGAFRIKLLDVDQVACPQIARQATAVERKAHKFWSDRCEYLSANDLTQAITGLVKGLHGFLLLDKGVVWALPNDALADYEKVADALAPYGVQMVTGVFSPVVNTRLVQHMHDELVKRSMAVFNGLIEEMDDLEQRGAKPRSNGQQTRLEEWIAAEETLQKHRGLLGKAFSAISKAARVAREKIGEAALEAFA